MKKFILNALLFCLAPLPVLYLLSYMVDKGLQKSRYLYYSEWNDIFDGKINADVLVLGASRAWVHVSPRILDSMLHVNSYNIGLDGSLTQLQLERLKIYLAHNKKPRYLLFEVDYTTSFLASNSLPGIQQFLPYLHDSTVWRIVTNSDKPLKYTDRYFPLFKYNNELPLIREGILSFFGKGVKSTKYKGYQGQDKPWDYTFNDFEKTTAPHSMFPIEPAAVADLQALLLFCKTNEIKVVLFYAPQYEALFKYVKDTAEKLVILDSFSRAYDAPFLNYSNDTMCFNKQNFYNSMHLNKAAAERFSIEFAGDLKQYIKPDQP